MADTFVCERCGRELPKGRMKEVVFEVDHDRTRKEFCPDCLDEVMNAAADVRGVVGEEKRAAAHIDLREAGEEPERESLGHRG